MIHLVALRTVLGGEARVVARLDCGRLSRDHSGCTSFVCRESEEITLEGLILLDKSDGLRIPVFPEGRVLLPPVSDDSALYFVFETGAEPRGELRICQDAARTDERLERVVFALGEAWLTTPSEFTDEMTVVKRVWKSGGKPEARRAYRTAVLPLFERSNTRWMEELQASLRSPLALVELERDMQPLAYAKQVLALSDAAEAGDLASFRKMLLEIPLTLQLNPDIQALQDRAHYVADDGEVGANHLLGQMHALLADGRHEEALALGDKLIERGDETARVARGEAVLGLAWLEVDTREPSEVLQRLHDERLEETLGKGHKGLQLLMEHLTQNETLSG